MPSSTRWRPYALRRPRAESRPSGGRGRSTSAIMDETNQFSRMPLRQSRTRSPATVRPLTTRASSARRSVDFGSERALDRGEERLDRLDHGPGALDVACPPETLEILAVPRQDERSQERAGGLERMGAPLDRRSICPRRAIPERRQQARRRFEECFDDGARLGSSHVLLQLTENI